MSTPKIKCRPEHPDPGRDVSGKQASETSAYYMVCDKKFIANLGFLMMCLPNLSALTTDFVAQCYSQCTHVAIITFVAVAIHLLNFNI
jgi:uncharacterized membrane protein YiaA